MIPTMLPHPPRLPEVPEPKLPKRLPRPPLPKELPPEEDEPPLKLLSLLPEVGGGVMPIPPLPEELGRGGVCRRTGREA